MMVKDDCTCLFQQACTSSAAERCTLHAGPAQALLTQNRTMAGTAATRPSVRIVGSVRTLSLPAEEPLGPATASTSSKEAWDGMRRRWDAGRPLDGDDDMGASLRVDRCTARAGPVAKERGTNAPWARGALASTGGLLRAACAAPCASMPSRVRIGGATTCVGPAGRQKHRGSWPVPMGGGRWLCRPQMPKTSNLFACEAGSPGLVGAFASPHNASPDTALDLSRDTKRLAMIPFQAISFPQQSHDRRPITPNFSLSARYKPQSVSVVKRALWSALAHGECPNM